MDQYIKIDANQSSFNLTDKNLVDFDLPQGAVYDLSKSYVAVRVAHTAELTANSAGICNSYLTLSLDAGKPTLHYPNNAALVKNASWGSAKKGKLEDIRHVEMLRNTLAAYKQDIADQSEDNGKLNHFSLDKIYPIHPQNEINKVGSELSRRNTQDVVIKLSDIYNIAHAEEYDGDNYGISRLHMEMNFNKLSADIGSYLAFNTKRINNDADRSFMESFDSIGVTGAQQTITALVSAGEYKNIEDIPFWVGESVIINFINDVTGGSIDSLTITSIEQQDDAAINVTFSGTVATIAATGAGLSITNVRPNFALTENKLDIENVELVAYVNNSGGAAPSSLAYTAYLSEEDSYPATNSATRMYQIPPAVKNVLVMFFSDGTRSAESNLDKYRFTVNNKEIVPRAIKIGSGIHYDLINQVFLNGSGELKSLLEKQWVINADAASLVGEKCRMIALPVPFSQAPQQLQLELEAVGGQVLSGHHILYYEQVQVK